LPRVLVAEPSAPISAALRKFLAGEADVKVVHFLDEAVQEVRANAPQVLIASVSASFEGETLAAQTRRLSPTTSVILVYPPDEEDAAERAEEAGVDSFLVGPVKKLNVLAAVRGVLAQRFLRLRVQELEQELENAKRRAKPKPTASSTGVNVADQAFFKKYLLLEVKRSKRYRYPLALMLVCPDGLEAWLKQQSSPEFQRATVRAEMMAQVASLIRDIDLAVPFARDKLLVFLPNTPGKGAATVAHRIVDRMQHLHSWPGGTASVGLAGYEPKVSDRANISFGALVRDATNALKQAQSLGGNRAEAAPGQQLPRRSRISMG